MLCWFFHRRFHVVLARAGDWSRVGCAKCECSWFTPRLTEPKRFAKQAKIDAGHSGNPYDLTDYVATRDGYDPGEPDGDGGYDGGDPIGRGETRWEAIRDLLELEAQ